MGATIAAAVAYFVIVYGAGFAMGALRVLFVAPRTGEFTAVVIELPIILAVSWSTCRAAVRWFTVPGDVGSRLAMGAIAFVLLMAAELALAVAMTGPHPGSLCETLLSQASGMIAGYRQPSRQLGLVGQIVFALLPVFSLRFEGGAR